MNRNLSTSRSKRRRDDGFTLIEVVIAIAVMSIGILSLVAVFGVAIAHTQSAEEDLIARQKVLEAMESIYTARNSQQLPFASVANVANGGIFLSNAQPMQCAGADGLINTQDDAPCKNQYGQVCPDGGAECMVLPGNDGILGTADDVTMSLGNFKRTVTITPVQLPNGNTNQDMKAISITVSYTKAGLPARSFTANGLISRYH